MYIAPTIDDQKYESLLNAVYKLTYDHHSSLSYLTTTKIPEMKPFSITEQILSRVELSTFRPENQNKAEHLPEKCSFSLLFI
jgi:penicillin V acylase-like amidase (Ntn superfamily)